MVHGLLLVTKMTFIMFYNFISAYIGIGRQDVVHNFKLKDGESDIFGYFEGNAINSADCLLV